MSFTLTPLRLEVQTIAPWLFPIISTMTGSPTTAYGVDGTKWADSNGDYLSAKSMVGEWIFRPASVTTERERRVGGNAGLAVDAAANFRFYHGGPVWTGAPVAGDAYEIHKLRPTESFNLLGGVLDQLLVATLQQLPSFTDSDMETTGVTNYTASNATLTKVATASQVYSGTQSQRVLLTGAGGYSRGPTYRVIPGLNYFVSAMVRADVGGPFILVVWDATNGAEINSGGRVSHSLEQFMSLQRQFTTPATCEEVQIEMLGTANTDDGYWDTSFGPMKQDDMVWKLPSWLNRTENLRKIMSARYTTQYADGVFGGYSRTFDRPFVQSRDYQLRVDPHHANPYTLEFRRNLPLQELWMEALRPASDVYTLANTAAGESSPTVNLDQHMVALLWTKAMCEYVLAGAPNDVQATATLAQIEGPKGKIGPLASLLKDYERDLVTEAQEPVVLPTFRKWF